MNTALALEFLANHQPMPSDDEIGDADCKTYVDVLNHFQQNRDPRCIPLLVRSVSRSTGMGMYEDIRFVLLAHAKEDVCPHVQKDWQTETMGSNIVVAGGRQT